MKLVFAAPVSSLSFPWRAREGAARNLLLAEALEIAVGADRRSDKRPFEPPLEMLPRISVSTIAVWVFGLLWSVSSVCSVTRRNAVKRAKRGGSLVTH